MSLTMLRPIIYPLFCLLDQFIHSCHTVRLSVGKHLYEVSVLVMTVLVWINDDLSGLFPWLYAVLAKVRYLPLILDNPRCRLWSFWDVSRPCWSTCWMSSLNYAAVKKKKITKICKHSSPTVTGEEKPLRLSEFSELLNQLSYQKQNRTSRW